MRTTTWKKLGVWLSLAAILLTWGCTSNGVRRVRQSPVIWLAGDKTVYLIEPNEPYAAPWPAAVLSRGYYMELVSLEMRVLSGQLVERKDRP